MTESIVRRVHLALTDSPEKAEAIAVRAELGLCQTYQALVRLNDRGQAHLIRGAGDCRHGIDGWVL